MAEEGSDRDVIQRVLKGDTNAFEHLVERYKGFVFQIVRSHVPSSAADDVAQEVFLDAFQDLGSFSQSVPFRHWISKLAVRRSYDYWRRETRKKERAESVLSAAGREWLHRISAAQAIDESARHEAQREAREVLEWALRQLTAEERTVLVLVYIEESSVREAAELLGWSVVNVKVRAFRARKRLRAIIETVR